MQTEALVSGLVTKFIYKTSECATRWVNWAVSINTNYKAHRQPELWKQPQKLEQWKLQFCDFRVVRLDGRVTQRERRQVQVCFQENTGRLWLRMLLSCLLSAGGGVAWRGDRSEWVGRNPELQKLWQGARQVRGVSEALAVKTVERSSIRMKVLWRRSAPGNLVNNYKR